MTTTRESRLLKTSAALALALLLLAPLASFASWGVSVGVGVGVPGPGYVWVPGYYGYSGWVPGCYVVRPFAGAVWVGPRWGFIGFHRHFFPGHWRHGFRRW